VATWLEDRTYAVTTTQTQKGSGEVSSTSQTPVLLSRIAHDQTCALVVGDDTYPPPISQCAAMYPV